MVSAVLFFALMTGNGSSHYSAEAVRKASDPLGSPLPFVRRYTPNATQNVIIVRNVRASSGALQLADVTAGACGGLPVERQIEVRNAPKLRPGQTLMIVLLNGDRPAELARWGVRETIPEEHRNYLSCVR